MRHSSTRTATLSSIALLLSAIAMPVKATTLIVTSTGEPATATTNDCVGTQCTTLRGAISAAASGDTIVFDAAALDGHTITLTLSTNDLSVASTQFGPSAFFITGGKSLTIDATVNGLTQGVAIVRSGAGSTASFRFFDVNTGSTLSLRGLTLRNGLAQGGDGSNGGGAIGAGGAIFNRGTLDLQQCALVGNVAQGGRGSGGAGSTGGGGVGETSISGIGGGPHGGAAGTNTVNGNGFPGSIGGMGGGGGKGGNSSTGGNGGDAGDGGFGGGGGKGGDASFGTPSNLAGDGGRGGFGGGGGGGGFAASGAQGGIAGFGGGAGSFLNQGGGGGGMGGAIFNDAGTVTLTNVTLAENRASGGSAGSSAGKGSGYGGAVFNYAGQLTMSFVTAADNMVIAGLAGNGGSAQGGAIFSLGDTLGNCNSGGNFCASGGSATLILSNTIAANSTGTTTDIVSHASYTDTSVFVPNATTLTGVIALGTLPAPLRGGRVDVMIPPSGSSALDAGGAGPCAVSSDQRGVSRPQSAACDIGAAESDSLFSNGFDGAPSPLVQCSGMINHTDALIETFAGSALSMDWTQHTNGGAVTTGDGIILTSATTTFPFITSAIPIIPSAGDFSVRWRARYTNLANQGTGTLVLSNGLPVNAASDSIALRSASAWQDSSGFIVRARTDASTYNGVYSESPAQNNSHDVEYCWIGSQNMFEVWVDGTRQLQAPNTGLTRPTSLWFGNPVVAGGTAWSSFKLDHVFVRSVSP